jgi:hypothetical protein
VLLVEEGDEVGLGLDGVFNSDFLNLEGLLSELVVGYEDKLDSTEAGID